MTKRLSILLSSAALATLAALPILVPARPGFIEQSFRLRHIKPTDLAQRFAVLGGLPIAGDFRVSFTPDDSKDTLTIRIHENEGTEMKREQLQLVLEDAIERYDVPTRPILADVYVVRTGLLTDGQFRELDGMLRQGPLELGDGKTAKGVVWRKSMELPHLEIVRFGDTQDERFASTQPEPATTAGEFIARVRRDQKVFLSIDMAIGQGTMARAEDGDTRTIRINGGALFPPGGVLVFAGGERKPLDATMDAPMRHEVMVYVIARTDTPRENP